MISERLDFCGTRCRSSPLGEDLGRVGVILPNLGYLKRPQSAQSMGWKSAACKAGMKYHNCKDD
jgi:hypothetical protein